MEWSQLAGLCCRFVVWCGSGTVRAPVMSFRFWRGRAGDEARGDWARHFTKAESLPCLQWRREDAFSMPSKALALSIMAMPFLTPSTALLRPHSLQSIARRTLHTSVALLSKQLPPRRVIPESEIIENFLKGSGPGGQKINKTSSAVQLKHIPTGIVVKYQDTRSRALNRKTARKLLQDRLEEHELGDDARTRVKAREKSKKKASSDKKKRRKYRALEAARAGEEGIEEGDELEELERGTEPEIEETSSSANVQGKSADTQDMREDAGKAG